MEKTTKRGQANNMRTYVIVRPNDKRERDREQGLKEMAKSKVREFDQQAVENQNSSPTKTKKQLDSAELKPDGLQIQIYQDKGAQPSPITIEASRKDDPHKPLPPMVQPTYQPDFTNLIIKVQIPQQDPQKPCLPQTQNKHPRDNTNTLSAAPPKADQNNAEDYFKMSPKLDVGKPVRRQMKNEHTLSPVLPKSGQNSGQDEDQITPSQQGHNEQHRSGKNAPKVMFTALKQVLLESELKDEYGIDMDDYLKEFGSTAYGHRNLRDFQMVLWYVQWRYEEEPSKYDHFVNFLNDHRQTIEKHGKSSYQNEHQKQELKAYESVVTKFYNAINDPTRTEVGRLKKLYGGRTISKSSQNLLRQMKQKFKLKYMMGRPQKEDSQTHKDQKIL